MFPFLAESSDGILAVWKKGKQLTNPAPHLSNHFLFHFDND